MLWFRPAGHWLRQCERATAITMDKRVIVGLDRNCNYCRARRDDGCRLIPIQPIDVAIALYNVALTSLGDDRILGRDPAIARAPPWATPARCVASHPATVDQA